MSENILKFNNVTVNKKDFHKSKQPIDLDLVTVHQIVVSEKFKGTRNILKTDGKTCLSWLKMIPG